MHSQLLGTHNSWHSKMAGIVFDLDGTLIDSAPDLHCIANKILQQEDCEPITLTQAREFVGNGASVFVQRMRAVSDLPDTEHKRILAEFLEQYEHATQLTKPYPGVVDTLSELKTAGHSLGICTNKPVTPSHTILRYLGLDTMFDTVWGGDSLPVHKPDAAPLIAAFNALPPNLKVYVGDSEVDASTAKSAGIPFLLYTEGYRKTAVDEIPHAASFSDYAQLKELIDFHAR